MTALPRTRDPDLVPHERPETLAEFYARLERVAREEERLRSEAAAEEGRWLLEREAAELEGMLLGPALDDFIAAALPARLDRRAEAAEVLARLRAAGCEVAVADGAARVAPLSRLPRDLAGWLADPDNRACVEDLIDERDREGPTCSRER
ncbi:unnamed protein product [Gemmataceae bacterium]|nr:unnamed protein product [Gemmataceae bacterium]VTT98907.1 unnamed protein product [Gemmataceae bacterium]